MMPDINVNDILETIRNIPPPSDCESGMWAQIQAAIEAKIRNLYAKYPQQDLACGDGHIYVRDPSLGG